MRKVFLILSAVFLLSFTQIHAEETACTMQYDPVCGTDADGVRQTFGNSCVAGASNATDIVAGECDTPMIGGETDPHGCLAGAGYIWDETLLACVRPWESEYLVSWAHELGLTQYDTPDTFGFDRDISRQEASAMLARFVLPVRGVAPVCPVTYKDLDQIDPSLVESVDAACGYDIMVGMDGYFSPRRFLSESEILALIVRTVDGKKQDENVTPWYTNYTIRAAELGIVSMVDENTMNDPVTRGDFIQWLNMASRSMTSAPSYDTDLLGEWQLLSLNGKSVTDMLSGTTTSPIVLTFNSGTLSTRICNNTAGAYTTSDGGISAPVLMSTLMACMDARSTIEQAFTPDGATYTIKSVRDVDGTGSELITLFTMTTSSGDVFVYKALPEPPANALIGTWKFFSYATDDTMIGAENYPDIRLTFTDDRVSTKFCNSVS